MTYRTQLIKDINKNLEYMVVFTKEERKIFLVDEDLKEKLKRLKIIKEYR